MKFFLDENIYSSDFDLNFNPFLIVDKNDIENIYLDIVSKEPNTTANKHIRDLFKKIINNGYFYSFSNTRNILPGESPAFIDGKYRISYEINSMTLSKLKKNKIINSKQYELLLMQSKDAITPFSVLFQTEKTKEELYNLNTVISECTYLFLSELLFKLCYCRCKHLKTNIDSIIYWNPSVTEKEIANSETNDSTLEEYKSIIEENLSKIHCYQKANSEEKLLFEIYKKNFERIIDKYPQYLNLKISDTEVSSFQIPYMNYLICLDSVYLQVLEGLLKDLNSKKHFARDVKKYFYEPYQSIIKNTNDFIEIIGKDNRILQYLLYYQFLNQTNYLLIDKLSHCDLNENKNNYYIYDNDLYAYFEFKKNNKSDFFNRDSFHFNRFADYIFKSLSLPLTSPTLMTHLITQFFKEDIIKKQVMDFVNLNEFIVNEVLAKIGNDSDLLTHAIKNIKILLDTLDDETFSFDTLHKIANQTKRFMPKYNDLLYFSIKKVVYEFNKNKY